MDGIKLGEEVLGIMDINSSMNMTSGTIDIKVTSKLGELNIIGLDHGALVIKCANGRIRLIALTDLVDLEEVDRENLDYEDKD